MSLLQGKSGLSFNFDLEVIISCSVQKPRRIHWCMSQKGPHPLMLPFIFLGCFFAFITGLSFQLGWGLLIRAIIFVFSCFVLIVVSVVISLIGPRRVVYKLEDWDNPKLHYRPSYDTMKWNITLNTHTHTRYSDGKLSIEGAIKYHMAVGFNACVFTDHNTMENLGEVLRMQDKYAGKFVVIPGVEWTTARIHMCFLGIREWDCTTIPAHPMDEQIQAAIAEVHLRGGVVVVCHYPWSTGGPRPRIRDHPTRQQVLAWGADLLECANWDDDIALTDPESYEFCKNNPAIGPCAGTDMHDPIKNKLCGWTLLHAGEFTEDGIMKELRSHRTDVVLQDAGIPYPVKHSASWKFNVLRPLYMLGDMWKNLHRGGTVANLDTGGLVAWFGFLFLLFALVEGLRALGLFG